jgi:hypothetical protein
MLVTLIAPVVPRPIPADFANSTVGFTPVSQKYHFGCVKLPSLRSTPLSVISSIDALVITLTLVSSQFFFNQCSQFRAQTSADRGSGNQGCFQA